MPHLLNAIHNPELCSDNTLHVVSVISNTEMYHSRYHLAREYIERMLATKNVQLHVVEAAFGDRQHEIEESKHGMRLRINSNCWIKENLINLGVRYLVPRQAKYIAWVDADVEFRDPYWAQKTLHQLQHFNILQPWQSASDLGPHGSVHHTSTSFGFLDQAGIKKNSSHATPYGKYGHTGYAWACTRTFWEQVGELPDFCILGSADNHMAWASVGDVDASIHRGFGDNYFRLLREWQARAIRVTDKEVGYVPGRIEHNWHGDKENRHYRSRWQILIENHFDPVKDLMHDAQGVVHIVGKPKLEQAIRHYNRSRLEDGVFT